MSGYRTIEHVITFLCQIHFNIMKDLRTLLEASILDIEDTLSKDINFELLLSASSIEQFNSYCNALKDVIEDSGNGPFNYKQLKKGKPYVFIFIDEWSDDGWVVSFVDKYPKQDPDVDYNDDTYYVIFWDDYDNEVSCRYDNTGNSFKTLLKNDFGKQSMQGAYEIPKSLLKNIKNITNKAFPYVSNW